MGRKRYGFVLSGFVLVPLLLSVGVAECAEGEAVRGKIEIPQPGYLQILTTIDGSSNIGRIAEIRENEVEFDTGFGRITIPISKIRKIQRVPASAIKRGQYWFPNPNTTRLYFSPTGRTLKKEEGYFANYYVFFPMVAIGLSDRVTVSFGMSLFPWIGFDRQIYYLSPKVGLVSTDDDAVSLGALLVSLPGDAPSVGVIYGVGTFGGNDGSITGGLGYGFVGWELADRPVLLAGGEQRLARRVSFVTENFIIPGVDQPLVSYGFRFFGEALSVDLALWNTIGDNMIFPGVPYVDFVYKF